MFREQMNMPPYRFTIFFHSPEPESSKQTNMILSIQNGSGYKTLTRSKIWGKNAIILWKSRDELRALHDK